VFAHQQNVWRPNSIKVDLVECIVHFQDIHKMSQYSLIDGKLIWEMHATHGLPIEFCLVICQYKGLIPTWEPLLRAAHADGSNLRRLVDRIIAAVNDAGYSKDVVTNVTNQLPLLPLYIELKQ
jgi:hypothetical protein